MEYETELTPKNMFAPISIVQIICVSVMLIVVLIIKLGFGDSFQKLQKWCKGNILEQTQITAVFDGDDS